MLCKQGEESLRMPARDTRVLLAISPNTRAVSSFVTMAARRSRCVDLHYSEGGAAGGDTKVARMPFSANFAIKEESTLW